MKILRLYYLLPPKIGGMEKHIYNLSKFQTKDHNIHIMFNYGNKVNFSDIKVLPFIKLYKIKPSSIGIILFYISVIFKLKNIKKTFDIIHIHGDWSSLLFVKTLKKLTNAKLVVLTLHDQLTPKYTHQKLLPKLVQNVDLIFSTGYDTAKELEKLSGKKIIVQPSGINDMFFEKFHKNFENETFTIITVANLFPKKNLELVLEIAKELKNYKFLIVGDGSERKNLENKIKNENIPNVELLGFKNTEEVKKYYQNSDVYLLTSLAEGTPTSALEAMACGLPVVSSNAGGLENIVKDNINGFIINDFDKYKYIEKIKLLEDINLRQKIFENNIKLSQKYKWENVAKNITEIMRTKLNEKN